MVTTAAVLAQLRNRGRRVFQALVAPVVLAALVTGAFWKITFTTQFTWLNSPDLAYQVLPWFQFQAREWQAGRFPAWDPYLWGGQPLVGQAQPGAVYPLNWVLFLLPLRDGYLKLGWLNWYLVIIHYLAAVFAYWLCRDVGCSTQASVFGAMAFSLGGYIGHVDWPQMLNGAVWAPLQLLFLLRLMRGDRPWRHAVLAGASLGMAWLSGHHQAPIFLTLAAAGMWLAHLWRARRPVVLLQGAAFGIAAGLLGAAQILPALEYGRSAVRWVGAAQPLRLDEVVPYNVHQMYSLTPPSIVGLVVPGYHLNTDPYFGFAALAAALVGVSARWVDWRTRVAAALAVGSLALALGGYSVFHGVLYSTLWYVDKARTPAAALVLLGAPLALLAAQGCDSLSHSPPWSTKLSLWLSGAAAVLMGVVFAVSVTTGQRHFEFERIGMAALGAAGAAIVLHAAGRGFLKPASAVVLLLLVAFWELAPSATYAYAHKSQEWSYLKPHHSTQDVAGFLRSQPGRPRFTEEDGSSGFNLGDWHGVEMYGGYLASLSGDLVRMMHDRPVQRLFGVAFHLGTKEPWPGAQVAFSAASGQKLYRVEGALPRVWTVHEAEHVPDVRDVSARLQALGDAIATRTILPGEPPALEVCAGSDAVRIADWTPGRIRIEAEMRCRGILVLAENHAPGWEARIDGRTVPVLRPYHLLRGVVVDGGRHHVEFAYRSSALRWGAGLSLLGVVMAVVATVWLRA